MMPYSIANSVPNQEQEQRFNLVTEVQRGIAVATKTFGLYGKWAVQTNRPLVVDPEYNGTLMGAIDPAYGPTTFAATYAQSLRYEDLAIMSRYMIKGGPTITSDGGTPAAGTIGPISPTIVRDDLDTFSFECGTPGLPFSGTMGAFDEWTISADIDNATAAWQLSAKMFVKDYAPIVATAGTATGGSTTTVVMSGASWTVNQWAGAFVTMLTGAAAGNVQEIASNTSTTLTIVNLFTAGVVSTDTFTISGTFTPGIGTRTRNLIAAPGTAVYLDPIGGTIGTTQLLGKVISFSVTNAKNLAGERFMENATGYSSDLGRGEVAFMGQLRVNFKDMSEYNHWLNKDELKLRFKQTGPALNAVVTNALAQLDLTRIVFDQPTDDVRNTKLSKTMSFKGYYDKTGSVAPLALTVKSLVTTFP